MGGQLPELLAKGAVLFSFFVVGIDAKLCNAVVGYVVIAGMQEFEEGVFSAGGQC